MSGLFFNARSTGLEPATSRVTGECSNQLSYDRILYLIISSNSIVFAFAKASAHYILIELSYNRIYTN